MLEEVVVVLHIDVEAVIVVELDEASFAWTRATDPDPNAKRRARKATVTRMHILIRLTKPTTFPPN
jgi:hypothetical protein